MEQARLISEWLDNYAKELEFLPGSWTWQRVMKVSEEVGEVYAALHGLDHGNPRKPSTTKQDVIDELADTAAAALCAIEHLTGNRGNSLNLLSLRMDRTLIRAGLVVPNPLTD